MDFIEVIRNRHAVRRYKKDPVPETKMKTLYEALSLAPSGNNKQPYRFIFVDDEEIRKQIAEKACHQDFIKDVPLIVVACCEPGRSFDTAIAVDHMVLAAVSEGLSTCWIGWFERETVKKILGIPDFMEVPILVTTGYADEKPQSKPKKSLEELIGRNRY